MLSSHSSGGKPAEFTKLRSHESGVGEEEDSVFDEDLSSEDDEKHGSDESDSLPQPAPYRGRRMDETTLTSLSKKKQHQRLRSKVPSKSITSATSSSFSSQISSIEGPSTLPSKKKRTTSHSPRYASSQRETISSYSSSSSMMTRGVGSGTSDGGISAVAPPRVDYLKHRTASLNGVHTIGKALERMGVTEDEIKRAKPLRMLGGSEDTFIESGRLMRYNPFEMYRVKSLPRDRASGARLCSSARDSSSSDHRSGGGSDFSFAHHLKDYIFTDDFWADESIAEPMRLSKKQRMIVENMDDVVGTTDDGSSRLQRSKTPRGQSVPEWAVMTRSCPSSPCRKSGGSGDDCCSMHHHHHSSAAMDHLTSGSQADILGLDAVFDDIPLTSDEDPTLPELVIDRPTPPQSDATAVSDDEMAMTHATVMSDATHTDGSPLESSIRYPWSKPVFASRSHLEMFQQRHHRSSTEDTRSAPAQMPARVRKMFGDDFAAARKANRILGTDPKEKLDQRSRMLAELGEKDEQRIKRERSAMDSSSKATFKRSWIRLKRSIISRSSKDDSMSVCSGSSMTITGSGSSSSSSSTSVIGGSVVGVKSESSRRSRTSRSEAASSLRRSSRSKSRKRESALGKIGSLLIRTNSNEGIRGFVQSEPGEEETTDSQQSLLMHHEEKASSCMAVSDSSLKRRSDLSLTSLLSLGSADDTSFIRQPSTSMVSGGMGLSSVASIGSGSALSSTVRRKKKYIEKLYLEPGEVQSEHRELVVDFVENDYTLEQVIEFFIGKLSLSAEDTIVILDAIDECNDLLCQSCDQRIKHLNDLSPFQFVVRTQVLDVQRFFHKYGPRVCRYHNMQSPLHLAARRLGELARDYQTHIVKTSPPELRIALKSFQFLMSVGYYMDDADWSQAHVCTPRALLKHTPRVLKQIDDSYRKILKNQRISMRLIAEETRLPLVLLRHLEFFTYNQIPRSMDYMITNQHRTLTRNRTLERSLDS